MQAMKEYFERYKTTLITVAIIAIIDEFLLSGSLRDRIRRMISGVLDSAESRLRGADKTNALPTTPGDTDAGTTD